MTDPPEGRPPSDEHLLLDALNRIPGAWAKLTTRLNPCLWSIARRRLPDLPADIQEEFVQEVWMRVASRAPEDFDPRSIAARQFVGQFVSAAINSVRANYCPAGQRTRQRRASNDVVSLAEIGLLEDERAIAVFDTVAARIDLQRLLAVAESKLRQGLELMRDEELTPTGAARRIGMARETYRRKMLGLPNLLGR